MLAFCAYKILFPLCESYYSKEQGENIQRERGFHQVNTETNFSQISRQCQIMIFHHRILIRKHRFPNGHHLCQHIHHQRLIFHQHLMIHLHLLPHPPLASSSESWLGSLDLFCCTAFGTSILGRNVQSNLLVNPPKCCIILFQH